MLFIGLISLGACSSLEQNPVLPLVKHLFSDDKQEERTVFAPPYHYLRVSINGRIVFMASNTAEIDRPDSLSVWYSAGGEVLRFRNGRLLAAVGLATEWREATVPSLPLWGELAVENQPLNWVRIRDVMPGYHFGLRDELVLRRISSPGDSQLKALDPHSLIWFEERFKQADAEGLYEGLRSSRYAVELVGGKERVLYGEQCVSADICFSWQRWPAELKGKA